jgi:sulfate adenylyltransferase subunit 1
MDLGRLFEEVFNKIKTDFEALTQSTFKEQNVSYIPLSALTGDNVESLGGMPWYEGKQS